MRPSALHLGEVLPSITISCMVWLHKGKCPCNRCRAFRCVRHHALAFYCRTSKENSNPLLGEDLFPHIFRLHHGCYGALLRSSMSILFLALFLFPHTLGDKLHIPMTSKEVGTNFHMPFQVKHVRLSVVRSPPCALKWGTIGINPVGHKMCCRAPVATNISPWMRINMLSCRVATTNIALLLTVGLLSGTTVIWLCCRAQWPQQTLYCCLLMARPLAPQSFEYVVVPSGHNKHCVYCCLLDCQWHHSCITV